MNALGRGKTIAGLMVALFACCTAFPCHGEVLISEFMAANDDTLVDGDGNYSDWVELLNTDSNSVDLAGWYLSDDTNDLQKWTFPATNIAAGGYLVVFASGQEATGYVDSLGYLHTTFKLSADGEDVILTRADGVTVEHAIAGYPGQDDDISYGIPRDSSYTTLIAADEDAKALIPTDDSASTNWHLASYDDASWLTGHQGVGYDTGRDPIYLPLVGLDVVAMQGQNRSVYTRIAFDVSEASSIGALSLRTQHDDGFVAFLNGVKIASANAPDPLTWNSAATARSAEADPDSYVDFDVSAYAGALQDGTNMLAIHGLNDLLNSSDLIFVGELNASVVGDLQTNTLNYLSTATPGAPNVSGFLGYVGDTTFTVDRGFFTNAFDVEIACSTAGSEIYYTTDGTTPATDNGTLYTGAVAIARTTVMRAAAFVEGHQPSDVDTQTYIFLDDIITQGADASGLDPYFPAGSVNGQVFDYAMDPDVVNSATYSSQIKNALLDIPSFSIVTDPDHLFDSTSGIYVNAMDDGALWERPTSIELINPDGSEGFQINGGIRIRGGMSRQASNPKHSFRLFFRSEYGAARLNYPLFGDEGADSYKRMDLRTGQNFSWHLGNSGASSTWLYDIFVRDAHREMGQPYTRGNFCHVYINGMYFGLFQTEERPESRYGETYFGGDDEDFDIPKSGDDRGLIEATAGNLDAYQDLWTAVDAGVTDNADYFAIQAMNPDGSENDSYTRLLDVDNVADYMLTVFYVGNRDSPLGAPSTGSMPRNLFALYNRGNPDGVKFIAHDAEHALGYHLTAGVDYNITAERSATTESSATLGTMAYFNPWWLHLQLVDNDEYKLRFADRVHRHFFNDGILTPENAAALLNARKAEMDMAIIAESARWGDYKSTPPRTKDDDWLPAVEDGILASYLQASPNTRRDVVLTQIRDMGWYPTVDAPEFNQHGGSIASGFALTITGDSQVYYTLDGSDPRAIGGAVAGTAYSSAVTLDRSALVKARVLDGGTWSALTEATFILNEASPLRVTEIMYNPAAPVSGSETNYATSDFEFIEVLNTGTQIVGLAGTEFADGVVFAFSEGNVATLDPGEYVVVVSDLDAFKTRYTNWASINIAGEFHGQFFIQEAALANAGEDVALHDGFGNTILDFEYNDWYAATEGEGFSLTLIDPTADTNTWSDSSSWRPSKYSGGTPGTGPESFLNPGDLVINEVLSHQDQDNPGDWVEVFNTSTNTISINGWYVSDDEDDLTKVQLSGLSTIAAGDYLVLTEFTHFGTNVVGTNGFAFNELGDAVYLSSGESGALTGYRIEEDFGAADRDVTFGRHVKSDGDADYPAMSSTTYGASNAYPRVGPIVISEVHYHPADSNAYEFVELYNTASSNVPLYDMAVPTNTWQLDGSVEFSFPVGVEMAPGSYLIISETNATAFTNTYSVPAGTTVLGPYDGKLNNDGETLRLERPGEPEALAGEVPEILVERVEYNDVAPWPVEADGGGASLERLDTSLYANDVANWTAGATPGPGVAPDSTTDADGDGMPDDWEDLHFGGANEVDGAATDDWDDDGASNYDEWRAGTNPTNSASVFAFTSTDVTTGLVLSWWSETGRVYSVWVCTNLVQGAFMISDTPIAATPPMNVHTTTQSGAACEWYQITVD